MTGTPTAVVEAFIACENAHDVDGAMALFHEYAVVRDAFAQHSGADQIRSWQDGLRAGNFHADIGPVEEAGEIAKFTGTVLFDPLAGMGVPKAEGEWELTVLDGRIALMLFAFSADSLAQIVAANSAG